MNDLNDVVLKYVGGGARVRDIPARHLTEDDLIELEDYCHEMIQNSSYKSLREFLIATKLYVAERRETTILTPKYENK